MSHPLVTERRAERNRRLDAARRYAEALDGELADPVAVVVVGSTDRGDWNLWSDIDAVVVADGLPPRGRDRLALTIRVDHPGLQGVAWTPSELDERRRRGDPMVTEADTVGVVVWGRLPPPEQAGSLMAVDPG